MKKFIKYSAIFGGVLVVLLVAAAAVLYSVVDTERVKSELTDLVREQTGRELVFKGDVGLSVFPWLGVEMGPVSLSNAPGFGDAPFAEIRRTNVKVQLLPLLSKDIRIKTLDLDGLSLNLARNQRGGSNWDDLAGSQADAGPAAKTTSQPADGGSATSGGGLGLASLAVGGVNISDARLTWDDAQSGQKASLSELNLSTGPLALGRPFDFSFATRAEAAEPALAADVDLSAQADLGQDFKTPTLRNLVLNLAADGEPLPGGQVDASVAGDIVIDLNKSTIDLTGLKLKTMDMELAGDVNVASFDTEPVIRTSLDFKEFNPKKIMAALKLPAIETTDPAALTRASGHVEATATTTSATVKQLSLALDDTKLTGSASVFNFSKPAIRFDLNADTLNVDRYLPPGTEDKTGEKGQQAPEKQNQAAAKKSADKDSASGLPKEELRALDVDGSVKVGNLVIYNLKLTDMNLTVKAKDGVIRVSPLSAGLYGGNFKTGVLADVSGAATRSKLDFGLADLQLGGLLADLIGEDKVTGLANLSLNLAATGEDWKSWAKTLTGKARVALSDGLFKGFQILPEKVRKKATATDPESREIKVQKQQPFKDITATFDIADGIVSTGDTTLTAEGIAATATGRTNLSREELDYKAVVSLTALPRIPVNITGHWTDPSVSLDTVAFLEETAKGIINVPVTIGKGAGDVGKGLLKGLGDGLSNIFGGKKKNE